MACVEIFRAIGWHVRGSSGSGWPLGAAGLLAALSSCVPQGSVQDEPGGVEEARLTASAAVPARAEALVRRAGADYEIEVVAPEGFVDGAFAPVLYVGDVAFRKGRASSRYRDHGLSFEVSSEEFAALEEGSSIRIQYGPSPRASRTFGSFSRSAVRQ